MSTVQILSPVPACLALCMVGGLFFSQQRKLGYHDTPRLPDSPWRVHDGSRPQPPSVSPGPAGGAPADALVLFDGSNLGEWNGAWKTDGEQMTVNGTGSMTTRRSFGDCQLHLEFATPAVTDTADQGRGNSGVFFMNRFEIQILDSFDNQTYPDGQCAALYGQCPPLVNACRAAGEWQTYDIVFKAPRYEGETLVRPASATVLHNGICVHADKPFIGPTTHRAVAAYSGTDTTGPIQLQDHGNPVRFRNIWVRELGAYDKQ